MNIAVLTHKPRPINIDKIFYTLKNELNDVLIIDVPTDECKKLNRYIKQYDLKSYDHVIFDIPFKRLHKQAKIVNTLKHSWIYEEDACQDFLPESKWYRKFTSFYHKLKRATIISTGYSVSEQLKLQGFACKFLPKGFNKDILFVTSNKIRSIPLGFIGTFRSEVYAKRKQMLDAMTTEMGLQCFRTQDMREYREKLNQIQLFFSADIGIGEYMCKNFEAMACGCVLVACQQGKGEEEALGLRDMENCILYTSFDSAVEKINLLLNNQALCEKIAEAGRQHVLARVEYAQLGQQLARVIKA